MTMAGAPSERGGPPIADNSTAADIADDLDIIRQQTRESLLLLRQLIEMLLPKGDPDKPKLEDLIAALVAQQARILAIVAQLGMDMSAVLDLLAPVNGSSPGGRQPTNGSLRS
jgi:hypothetical protein